MKTSPENPLLSRRNLLKTGTSGLGYLALSSLLNEEAKAAAKSKDRKILGPLAPKEPHFAPKAKRVIFCFMQGGPSHIDTFDYKPALDKVSGEQTKFTHNDYTYNGKLLASPFKFAQHGESGLHISELFPHLAKHADDLCLVNSMHTDNPAHPQATVMMHTGSINFVRPSMGSWVVYGLGTENQNLPGFVTINALTRLGGSQNYGSAFLPASYQGTRVTAGRNAIANISSATSPTEQRKHLDLIQAMNRDLLQKNQVDTQLEGVIESYELAFRMQSAVPDVMDLSKEPAAIRKLYGIDEQATRNVGSQCLMARRMAEAGVRFIEITHNGWDQHNQLKTKLPANCQAIDQPIAALLADLKQRDMLNDTLVVWGGEFGRTPAEQNNMNGRRHNNRGFTIWMAGGGVRGGQRYGATDETGWYAAEDRVHTHDLHATILHLLGLDHKRLTYRYAGRDFRLTDVHGDVVEGVIA